MHLLEVLREECGIVSAKNGCAPEGACGCCLVLIDGTPALSCLRKPEQTEGREVVTLEGIPEDVRKRMGEAFVLEGGVQCGFCIPGIVVRAASLVQQGKTGDRAAIAKALDGHLCRCTGTAGSSTRFRRRARRPRTAIGCTRTEPRRNLVLRRAVRPDAGIPRSPTATGDGDRRHGIGRFGLAPRRRRSRRSATSRSSTTCACRRCCTVRWC